MTRKDKIIVLQQVQTICNANLELLKVSANQCNSEGEELHVVSKLLIDACDRLNKLGLAPLAEETVNPQLN